MGSSLRPAGRLAGLAFSLAITVALPRAGTAQAAPADWSWKGELTAVAT